MGVRGRQVRPVGERKMAKAATRDLRSPELTGTPMLQAYSSLRIGVLDAPPRVPPPPESAKRPFWSVMIPIYNCREDYLRETLGSVLVQDPGADDMQIQVIDNCSTLGDPEAVVRELGGGRIEFHRQPSNLGIAANFNAC